MDNERPSHLRNLTDEQVALYHRMLEQASATRIDYWTTLRGLDAPAADKYAVADALRCSTEARKYAAQAGIDLTHTYSTSQGELTTREAPITDLRRGDRLVGGPVLRDGELAYPLYEVTEDCTVQHNHGHVPVREVGAAHVWDEREQAWSDEGSFAYVTGTLMNRVVSAGEAELRGRDPLGQPADSTLAYNTMSRAEYVDLRTAYLDALDADVTAGDLSGADREVIAAIPLPPTGLIFEVEARAGRSAANDESPGPQHRCPECEEPVIHRPPTANQAWADTWGNAHGRAMPQWSHVDGEPLCPVMAEHGYEPAQPKLVSADSKDSDLDSHRDDVAAAEYVPEPEECGRAAAQQMPEATLLRQDDAATAASADGGRRYALAAPRGVSEFLDNLRPDADHHTITVHGSADLARRVSEADRAGVCVAWRQLDATDSAGHGDSQPTAEAADAGRVDDGAEDGWEA